MVSLEWRWYFLGQHKLLTYWCTLINDTHCQIYDKCRVGWTRTHNILLFRPSWCFRSGCLPWVSSYVKSCQKTTVFLLHGWYDLTFDIFHNWCFARQNTTATSSLSQNERIWKAQELFAALSTEYEYDPELNRSYGSYLILIGIALIDSILFQKC